MPQDQNTSSRIRTQVLKKNTDRANYEGVAKTSLDGLRRDSRKILIFGQILGSRSGRKKISTSHF